MGDVVGLVIDAVHRVGDVAPVRARHGIIVVHTQGKGVGMGRGYQILYGEGGVGHAAEAAPPGSSALGCTGAVLGVCIDEKIEVG